MRALRNGLDVIDAMGPDATAADYRWLAQEALSLAIDIAVAEAEEEDETT